MFVDQRLFAQQHSFCTQLVEFNNKNIYAILVNYKAPPNVFVI